MKRRDIIRRAGRNLRRAKGRTLLTALAISVGALTIALALAAGEGGRRYTESLVAGSGDSEVIYVMPKIVNPQEEADLPEYGVSESQSSSSRRALLGEKDIAALRAMHHAKEVVPVYSTANVQYVESGENGKKLVPEVTVKNDKTRMNIIAGSVDHNMPAPGQAIIAEKFLKQFGFANAEAALGKKLIVHAEKDDHKKDVELTIAAVDKESDTLVYYQPSVRIASEDAKLLYEVGRAADAPSEYYAVNVFADNAKNVAALQNDIKQHYEAYSLQDIRSTLLTMVGVAQYGLMAFGGLALLASVFGIINTMYISVLERTQQIGLMKALGASKRDIGRLFRYEAAWVGFLGGLIGVGIAWIVTLLNPVITSTLKLEAGTQLLVMTPLPIALLLAGLVTLAILSGWLPSRRAAKLDPIEALRTE